MAPPICSLFIRTITELNSKAHRVLLTLCIALFAALVGLSAEANARNSKGGTCPSAQQEQLCANDGRYDLHLAIENNSRFVAPPLMARIAGASVRILSVRNHSTGEGVSAEHRAGINHSNLYLKVGDDTRLYRLSPSRKRVRYIYSLRRIII